MDSISAQLMSNAVHGRAGAGRQRKPGAPTVKPTKSLILPPTPAPQAPSHVTQKSQFRIWTMLWQLLTSRSREFGKPTTFSRLSKNIPLALTLHLPGPPSPRHSVSVGRVLAPGFRVRDVGVSRSSSPVCLFVRVGNGSDAGPGKEGDWGLVTGSQGSGGAGSHSHQGRTSSLRGKESWLEGGREGK